MDDAGERESLFVVVSYAQAAPWFSSILQLQLDFSQNDARLDRDFKGGRLEVVLQPTKRIQVTEKDYVRRFSKPYDCPLSRWLFSPPTSSTHYKMYMVPDYDCPPPYPNRIPLRGNKFSFSTGESLLIKPPMACKYDGHIVTCNGRIYFMAHPDWYYHTPDPVFECYDPHINKWKALQPFPHHDVYLKSRSIVATAVLDDTIVYVLSSCEIWAYNVPEDKWYIVHVENDLCYHIIGEAVVLENTIYALTGARRQIHGSLSPDLVLALSIERKVIGSGDLVYRCSLRSQILVPGLKRIEYEDEAANIGMKSRHLVYLGGDYFCIVQSCKFYGRFNRYQPIQVTKIKRMGNCLWTVTDITLYEVEVSHNHQFQVELCFSLPNWRTAVLEEGKGFTTPLDPEPIFGGAVPGSSNNTDEEGRYIYIRNWPPNATFKQVEEILMKFGPITKNGIQVMKNKKGLAYTSCAIVEFERVTSKRLAIKASPMMIGDCQVEIKEP